MRRDSGARRDGVALHRRESLAQPDIGTGGNRQLGHSCHQLSLVQLPQSIEERLGELAFGTAGGWCPSNQLVRQLGDQVLHRSRNELRLVLEVVLQRADADAGALCHATRRDAGVALVDECFDGGREQRLPCARATFRLRAPWARLATFPIRPGRANWRSHPSTGYMPYV